MTPSQLLVLDQVLTDDKPEPRTIVPMRDDYQVSPGVVHAAPPRQAIDSARRRILSFTHVAA